jgi:hypothetical protein
MFRTPGLVFDGNEGVGSRFNVLHARTLFQRYRGRPDPFSCFAIPDSFLAVPRASGPVLMLCAPGLVFYGTEGVGSQFYVLRARTIFRRYRGGRVTFSCFRARTHFLRYRGRPVPFSCFALPDSFSAVPRASGPVFMFGAPGLVFGGIEGVGSRFHVSRSRTRFRRYWGCRVSFSCFALPDSFSAVTRAWGTFFMFFAPGLIFGDIEVIGPLFMICAPGLIFGGTGTSSPVFMFCAAGIVVGGTEDALVPFSCFARPDSFSALARASGPVFMCCAPGLVFGSPGVQNIKMGPDALDTAENESGSAKHEIGARRPRYRQKRVRERKT